MTAASRSLLVLPLLVALAARSPAQAASSAASPGSEPIPSIEVTGSAEVTAPAARGAFSIGIEVTRPTAAEASSETARLTQAVTAALKQAGLAGSDLKGSRLTVNPQWSYDQKTQQRHRDGFEATTTLLVDSASLEHLGSYIDAALGAGATTVSDIQYSPADADSLRRDALTRAVRNARSEAETIAAAAGGQLGALLQIGTDGASSRPRPMGLQEVVVNAARAKGSVATDLMPQDIEVSASVSASWRFQSAAHGTP